MNQAFPPPSTTPAIPPENLFYTIIVSGRTFRVSHATLWSDRPNYFTNVFTIGLQETATRTVYIDRDADTFADIVRHLQGYFINVRDQVHNENLMADAHYYQLAGLKKTLRDNIFINIGGTIFRLSRETANRDAPNFLTMLVSMDASRELTPAYMDRDPELFRDIIRHLQGYQIHIRDCTHRLNLMRDAQFYHLKKLRDKLLSMQITTNGYAGETGLEHQSEILLQLGDVRVANLSIAKPSASDAIIQPDIATTIINFASNNNGTPAAAVPDTMAKETSPVSSTSPAVHTPLSTSSDGDAIMAQSPPFLPAEPPVKQRILYRSVDDTQHVLLIQLTNLDLWCNYGRHKGEHGDITHTMYNFYFNIEDNKKLQDICSRLHLTEISSNIDISDAVHMNIDGTDIFGRQEFGKLDQKFPPLASPTSRCKGGEYLRFFLRRCILSLVVQRDKLVPTLVKAEGFSNVKAFNARRAWLDGGN